MRRSEREIKDRGVIDVIIRGSQVCRIGLAVDGEPYVVPVSFGYDGQCLYFHGAAEGKKMDMLRRNPRVCFEFDIVKQLVEADKACDWGMKYQSVIGFGTAEILENPQEKAAALAVIMRQYSPREFSFPPQAVDRVCVVKITIESLTGKHGR